MLYLDPHCLHVSFLQSTQSSCLLMRIGFAHFRHGILLTLAPLMGDRCKQDRIKFQPFAAFRAHGIACVHCRSLSTLMARLDSPKASQQVDANPNAIVAGPVGVNSSALSYLNHASRIRMPLRIAIRPSISFICPPWAQAWLFRSFAPERA